jgi:putative peptide zinc metalloprotease protein
VAAVRSDPAQQQIDEAWQSIATLKLSLGRSLHFYQHRYRGVPWLIIADQRKESYFRCSTNAGTFLGLLDGSRSVEQAFQESQQSGGPTLQRQDIVLLIANLKSAGLLQENETATDGAAVASKPNRWLRPFAIKFPLFDPDRFLQKTLHLVAPLFSPGALVLWIALVVLASITAMLHWSELVEYGQARFDDPRNLFWYWLLYPLLKALHEFGHAYATRKWGGAVNEMGVMLLVFFPVPYVDSSAAHRFSSKQRRLLVNAAGIMVEVCLAAIALLVWVNIDHGLLRDLAFDIVIIGGVSTLVFNANPLLRFDGYYLLSELIEIPNLGTRADQYLAYWCKRYLLDMPGLVSPVTAAGEVKWLVVYGICSRIYRVLISLVIAFWVAGQFMIVGVLLAIWAIGSQIVYPLGRGLCRLLPALLQVGRMARFSMMSGSLVLIALLGLLLPTTHSTYSEGIVSLPENALIRAATDGVVSEVVLGDGDRVGQFEVVLRLENIMLLAERDMLLARLDETRARLQAVFLRDRSEADIFRVKVASLEAALGDVAGKLRNLEVQSALAGVVSLPMASDLPGRYIKRGEVVGYVAGQGRLSALVAVSQLEIDQVRQGLKSIEVKLSSRPGETFDAQLLRELPQGTDRLPNRMLGSASGGDLAVDARDENGVQLLSNVFLLEIGFPPGLDGNFLGQRVFVRFVHRDESLGKRLARRFSQFVLQAPFV